MTETITKSRQRTKKVFPNRVRLCAPDELAGVAELLTSVGWPEAAALQDSVDVRLVALEGTSIVGHIAVTYEPRGCLGCDECDGVRHARRGAASLITCLAVSPTHRGSGLAKDLLRAAKLTTRQMGLPWLALDVEHDNTKAMSLYKAMGFRPTGARSTTTRDGIVRLRRHA